MVADKHAGLERTDNNMDLTTWPQVGMINQKNYYTEFLKRDEQFLAVRYPKDEERARIVQEARDKDRARALGVPTTEGVTPQAADETMEDADVSFASRTDISKLIVIHPGSQNLRIGLGSDALPKTVPMVIARKWKESEDEEDEGEPSPKRMKVEGAVPADALPEKWFGEDVSTQDSGCCHILTFDIVRRPVHGHVFRIENTNAIKQTASAAQLEGSRNKLQPTDTSRRHI
jgi:actin-related protein 8